MKHALAIILLTLATSPLVRSQSPSQTSSIDQQSFEQRAARVELYKAAQAFKTGEFAEAQRLSERALVIDPSSKTATVFIARSIHAQFRPGVDGSENIAKANEAIAAYQRILLVEPENEEAYKAIAALYGAIGEDDLQYNWISLRAFNVALSVAKRVEAYVILASKDWNCSFAITEQPKNKLVARTKSGTDRIVHKKPDDQLEFDKAQQCAVQGMRMVETAITLDSENPSAWSFRSNLLIEMGKLAEMEGDTHQRDEYNLLADESQTHTVELSNKQQLKSESTETASQSAVSLNIAGIASGSVLEGKAISIPRPIYPPIAKTAGAYGTVVVEIIVDEQGNVIEAFAASGHPLLRAAAVNSARQARFSPTILSGQPVKVAGALRFTFNLK